MHFYSREAERGHNNVKSLHEDGHRIYCYREREKVLEKKCSREREKGPRLTAPTRRCFVICQIIYIDQQVSVCV